MRSALADNRFGRNLTGSPLRGVDNDPMSDAGYTHVPLFPRRIWRTGFSRRIWRIRFSWHLPASLAIVVMAIGTALAADSGGEEADSLRNSYAQLRGSNAHNAFGQPLSLESSEVGDVFTGDVRAVIEHPYPGVRAALASARSWCDILILHPNVMGCRVSGNASGERKNGISVRIGMSKQAAEFSYDVAANRSDYLDVRLTAPIGPLGTTDHRIRLEATPLDERRTILHLVYSNRYGPQARMAMRVYLSTLGRGKVGFTVVGHEADGRPVYVDDFRGAQERNAMRYYLAINAYFESLSVAPARQFERRLATWYAFSARYSPQLHEEPEYLDIRRRVARESALAVPHS